MAESRLLARAVRWLQRKTPSRFDSMPNDVRLPIATLLADLRTSHLTYVGMRKLKNLAWAAYSVREARVPGIYVEAGVALGGTAILLGRMKPPDASLQLCDVFGMIPPPTAMDDEDAHRRYEQIRSGKSAGLGDETYYGYRTDLISVVRDNLQRYGLSETTDRIRFCQGEFERSLWIDEPVALAHIDCDWYASVRTCIERIVPHLSPGGIIVFDDYKSYSGCRRAVDEMLHQEPSLEIVFTDKSVGVRRRDTTQRLRPAATM